MSIPKQHQESKLSNLLFLLEWLLRSGCITTIRLYKMKVCKVITTEYSSEILCACVCVCVFLHDNSKNEIDLGTCNLYIVVYENNFPWTAPAVRRGRPRAHPGGPRRPLQNWHGPGDRLGTL